jgi:hypothetical protein
MEPTATLATVLGGMPVRMQEVFDEVWMSGAGI